MKNQKGMCMKKSITALRKAKNKRIKTNGRIF